MLTSSSPLLERQDPTDMLNQRPFASPQKTALRTRSRTNWTWFSVSSFVFNATILLSLLYGVGTCTATIRSTLMPGNEYCLHTVSTSYNYITFTGEGYGTYYGPKCLNPLRTISTYASGKTFCKDKEILIGFEKIRRECEDGGLEFLDWQQVVSIVTDDDIAQMRVVEFNEVPEGTNITDPVRLSNSFFERVGNTLMTWEYEMNWHHQSGFALYAFWSIVLGVSTIVHVVKSTNLSFQSPNMQSSTTTQILQSAWTWARVNLVIPPAFGSHHQRLLYWCTIPTRIESIVVLAFYLLTTYLSLSHYLLINHNIYWHDKSQQLWRYVADRTGIMAYATLPWIWIFAGRNNIFMWATGLSYRTFNIYHRHIARAGTILAVVHSVVYTWLFVDFEGWGMFRREFTQLWLLLGVLVRYQINQIFFDFFRSSTDLAKATITMSLLLLFSVSWLRIKFYELFLVLHIVLSVVTLVGCFSHTSIFDARYDAYLWPIVVVWVLDRALRLLRLLICNVQIHLGKQVIHHTHSVASYSKESDVIRLDLKTESFLARSGAGQFYYLYQPDTWRGYENHPFTLGAWSSGFSASVDAGNHLLQYGNMPHEFEEDESSSRYSSTVQTLTFWIRPYNGWTRRLRDECLRSDRGVANPTILLEGPYGHHCPVSSFDSVLLIAGGTGIASAVPYILEHAALSKRGKTDTTRMHLLWTVRQVSFIEEVFAQELRTAAQRDDFTADLFFTRQSEGSKYREEQPRDEENDWLRSQTQYGRPDIAAAIAKAAIRAETTGTKVAVLVCGPPAMADEARLAVHRSLKCGCRSVHYFEESFGW